MEGTFTSRNLAPKDIKMVVDEVNKISHKTFGEEKDLIGRVEIYNAYMMRRNIRRRSFRRACGGRCGAGRRRIPGGASDPEGPLFRI